VSHGCGRRSHPLDSSTRALSAVGFRMLRANQDAPLDVAATTVRSNQYREGDVVVQVLGGHTEFLRAREVLGQRWQVRYDRLGHVWLVS